MQKAITFNGVAIVSVKGDNNKIHFWYMSKDEATDIIKNSDSNNRWIIIEIWNIKAFLVYIYKQKTKKNRSSAKELAQNCYHQQGGKEEAK